MMIFMIISTHTPPEYKINFRTLPVLLLNRVLKKSWAYT